MCQAKQTPGSSLALPSQVNFWPSNCVGRAAEHRLERGAAGDQAELGAILGRHVVEVVGREDAAGALHVLDHDRGRARQMLRQMPRHRARIGIVGAARVEADDQVDRAAFVELLDGLRARQAPRRRTPISAELRKGVARMLRASLLRRSPEHLRGLGGDVGRRAVGVVDESRDRAAASSARCRLGLLGIGEQRGVLHRRVEALAQRLHAILRHARRRADRPLEIEPAEHQPEDLPVLLATWRSP